MEIKSYIEDRDYSYLADWLKQREMPKWEKYIIPTFGYVAFDGDERIAMGFLRRCEGRFTIVDSFITNPKISGEKRNEALNIVLAKILLTAKEFGSSSVLAFTTEDNIYQRAKRFGFDLSPGVPMILNFKDEK